MNPIKSRLNRDNFWNLMFWFGMSFGTFLAEFTNMSILFWITAILVPYFIKQLNKFKADKTRLHKKIDSKTLFIVFVASIFLTGLMISTINKIFISDKVLYPTTMLVSFFIILPVLFSICKNFLIVNLFNKEIWETNHISYNNSHILNIKGNNLFKPKSTLSPNYISDPRYSGLSFNIHNSNYHKK